MKIQDLGELQGPVLLFGGPYSNLPATHALICAAQIHGIPSSHCICTGDVVAYGAHPGEVVEAVRAFGCPVVAGNMELQLGANAADCGCGFEDGTACDVMSGAWYAHATAAVTQSQRDWMAACPDLITFWQSGRRVAVVHGGVTDVARFIWSVSAPHVFAEEWTALERALGQPVDIVVAGHSGIGFLRDVPQGMWINAGVIGMPPHDGAPQTEYAMLENGEPRLCRLSYDEDAAADAMEAAGLTQGYHRALVTGYWPSEDVLPPSLTLSSRASG